MKWKCTYTPEEEQEAAEILAVLLRRYPGSKVRKSEAHPPYKAFYLTTRIPDRPQQNH